MKLPWGMFGENFTSAGLFESELNIGDKLRVGSAVMMVTEPRMPCYKLGIKFGRPISSRSSWQASVRASILPWCKRARSEWVTPSN